MCVLSSECTYSSPSFFALYEIRRERRALLPRQHGQHVATLDPSFLAYLLTFTCTSCIAVAI